MKIYFFKKLPKSVKCRFYDTKSQIQGMMGGYNNYNRPQMGQYPNQQYQNQPQMNPNFQQQNYQQRFPPNQAYPNQSYQNPGAYQQQMNPAFMNQRMPQNMGMRMGNPNQVNIYLGFPLKKIGGLRLVLANDESWCDES